MTLPSFLIIGAQKAGTSWFAEKLRQHPDVYMPARELHYFDKDSNFRRGLSWYESHFAEVKGQRALGGTTTYAVTTLASPGIAPRPRREA